jgi:hypothetical protein
MKYIFISIILVHIISTKIFSQSNIFCNGGFDDVACGTTVALVTNQQLPCWQTTATDGKMEIWNNGYNGVPSYSGNQFLEMNATMPSTLYQNINIVPGKNISIGFAHRGRGGIDSISVSIGPVGGPYTTLGYFGNDQYSWGYYTINYTVPENFGDYYSLRFNSIYWGGGILTVGNFLDAVSVSPNSPFSEINEIRNNLSVSIYPNPIVNTAILAFNNPSSDKFTLTIFDSRGQQIRTISDISDNKVEIERQNLKSGLYFYQLKSDKIITSGKLIFSN